MRYIFLSLLFLGCVEPASMPALTPGALMEADRTFQNEVDEKGLEGWMRWFTEDAVRYGADGMPVQGRDAIRELDGAFLSDTTYALRWEPESAVVFQDSLSGLTRGRYQMTLRAAGDTIGSGRYSTLWRQTPEGPRVYFDAGEVDPR